MDGFDQPIENTAPWKKIAIIGGAALGVILIVVIVVLVVRARSQGQMDAEQLARTVDQVESVVANCDNAADPDLCRRDAIAEAALATGDSGVCDMLQNGSKDECLWDLAQQDLDVSTCRGIAEESTRVSCEDDVRFRVAKADPSRAECGAIQDPQTKTSCEDFVRGTILETQGCAAAGFSAQYCQGKEQLLVAVTKQDPDLCQVIVESAVRSECIEVVGSGDPDLDGLATSEEERFGSDPRVPDSDADGLTDFAEVNDWGTDPANVDTDGDSFPDGAEVAGGYNPLGAGTLE